MKIPFPSVTSMLDFVPGWLWAALLAGAVGHGCVVAHQRDTARVETAQLTAKVAGDNLERERVAREDAQEVARIESKHASLQTELSNEQSKRDAARAADDRARTAESDRLRGIVAAYAARGGAEGAPDASACRRDADRAERLGGLLEEALGLQDEGERLVRRRDAEVGRLLDQIRIDREAVAQ